MTATSCSNMGEYIRYIWNMHWWNRCQYHRYFGGWYTFWVIYCRVQQLWSQSFTSVNARQLKLFVQIRFNDRTIPSDYVSSAEPPKIPRDIPDRVTCKPPAGWVYSIASRFLSIFYHGSPYMCNLKTNTQNKACVALMVSCFVANVCLHLSVGVQIIEV